MSGDILLRQLEYLVALDREQHFGRAAAACHVSQPALSAALRKLESQLGVTIVNRGQRYGGTGEPVTDHYRGYLEQGLSQ